jgi:Tfp pilus assembly protein PilF
MSRLEKLQEFLIQDPSDSFTRYAIGLEYMSAKDFETAALTFEELLRLDPDYLATYYQLGAVYNELARMDEARAIYNRGIAAARKAGDTHTASEIEAALDEIEEDYEV